MSVKLKPEGYPTITPYLVVTDVEALLNFTKTVFGAEEIERITDEDGNARHVEIRIAESVIMIGPARDNNPANSSMLYIYVDDCDATYQKALASGGESVMEPADQFYGDRNGGVRGPCGNLWWLATHVEDLSQEEMQERALGNY